MGIKETKIWIWMRNQRALLASAANPEKQSLKIYRNIFGKEADLDNPVGFNEKIQWLKLRKYNHDSTITMCVDKYRIREYLKQRNMSDLLPKLYQVADSVSDISWGILPNRFVIKCNHGSGYNIICGNKAEFNKTEATKKIGSWMKEDYWKKYAEVQYRDVPKRIIIEENLGDDINTYKFYCFNGIPHVLYMSSNGENGEYDKYYDYFDMSWNHLDLRLKGHANRPDIESLTIPDNFDRMKEISKLLSRDFPFVRVDLYNINGKIYISGLTFIPTGGFMVFDPPETDIIWGRWLNL